MAFIRSYFKSIIDEAVKAELEKLSIPKQLEPHSFSLMKGGLKIIKNGANCCYSVLWSERSWLEVGMLSGLAGFVAYKYAPRFRFSEGKLKIRPPRDVNNSKVLESRRAGSIETTMTAPSCQLKVAQYSEGQYHYAGCVVRMQHPLNADETYLVGPDHLLGAFNTFVLSRDGKFKLKLDETRTRYPLWTDFVAILINRDEGSLLGARIAVLTSLPVVGTQVAIVGVMDKGTVGVLKHDGQIFGSVIYDGTTVGGYSGAAYFQGNAILGFHTAGGALNQGVNAKFIWACIKLLNKTIDEDSDDWLKTQFDNGSEIQIRSYGDPGYVHVKIGGDYALVERASMNSAFGSEWIGKTSFSKHKRRSYEDETYDVEFESMSENQKLPGASGMLEGYQGGVINVLEKRVASLEKSLKKRLNAARLQQPSVLLTPSTVGQGTSNSQS